MPAFPMAEQEMNSGLIMSCSPVDLGKFAFSGQLLFSAVRVPCSGVVIKIWAVAPSWCLSFIAAASCWFSIWALLTAFHLEIVEINFQDKFVASYSFGAPNFYFDFGPDCAGAGGTVLFRVRSGAGH